jgi:hypothetical protein
MTLSETFPGGSGHLPDVGRFFNGGARTPRATNLLSRSECSLKFADTVRDVGDVSFAFNLLMLTFFIPNLEIIFGILFAARMGSVGTDECFKEK